MKHKSGKTALLLRRTIKNFFYKSTYIFLEDDDRYKCKVNQVEILQFILYSYISYTCRARIRSGGDREVPIDIY